MSKYVLDMNFWNSLNSYKEEHQHFLSNLLCPYLPILDLLESYPDHNPTGFNNSLRTLAQMYDETKPGAVEHIKLIKFIVSMF